MRKYFSWIIIIAIVLGFILLMAGTNFYLDLLWFVNLDLEGVFWTQYLSSWGLRFGALLFFFLFLLINLMFTRRLVLNIPNPNLREKLFASGYYVYITSRRVTILFVLVAGVISFLFTSYTGDFWMEMQQYFNATDFGVTDPIFNSDVSYYIFQLPFLRFLYQFLMMMVVTTMLLVGAIYLVLSPPVQVGNRFVFTNFPGLSHISLLFALIFLLKAWDYRMQMLELLQSPRGHSFGAGYTDLAVNQTVLWVLLVMALVIGAVCLINVYMKKAKYLAYGVGAIMAVSILGGAIAPALVQSFLVSPSELSYERPYIEHNIKFTRTAFGLDRFKQEEHRASPDLHLADIEETPGTFNNIRLWDYRPIQQTYLENQAIRPYYTFVDVDIDRYMIDGEYRQVMLSAREMDQSAFDERAQTWINQRLQFTHGYGVAMSPVNEANPDGLPQYFLQDIPPQGQLELERPEIYYGELTGNYVIANTDMEEFNYPRGDTNVYAHYEGEGGVELHSLGRRLLFALRFAEYRVLLSGEINPESRFMFYRNVQDRVNKVAPFLEYDQDPYIVVSDGRLYWIQDAYTVSDRYPYSQPWGGVNYIRNSVKVVIDAYNGSMDFYMVEPDEPMVQTYSKIFPDLFKDLEEMPEGLRDHLRYPVDLFTAQIERYREYHVTNPTVFYNREDLWEVPMERYRGQQQPMEPYYVILQLPGEEREEFALINPYTPRGRRNMISWVAARSDYEHYGEVIVYEFPKDRIITGPMQIENLIDQDTDISEQLTLWDQAGSEVIRGNLLVIPIKESVLYVEPIFLQAEDGGIPELSRVIVAFGQTVAMERSLEEGLMRVLDERVDLPGAPDEFPDEALEEMEDIDEIMEEIEDIELVPDEVKDISTQLGELFQELQEKLQEMEELMERLEEETR